MGLKLRGRVLLLVLAVAFAAVALASLVLHQRLGQGFSRYLSSGWEARMDEAVNTLADHYRRNGSWAYLAGQSFLPGFLVALEDPQGRPVLVQRGRGPGWMHGLMGGRTERRPITVDGRVVGRAVFLLPAGVWSTAAERVLRRSINRSLALAGLSAAALAVLLGLAFARQLTAPLARIEGTARAMAGGDLDRRAAVGGAEEFTILARTLNDLASRVQNLLHERRQLAADLAHELRTPLTILRSLTESFLDGVLPPDRANLTQLREEIERLQVLVDRIQEAFLAADRAVSRRDPVDLRALAESLAARFGSRYTAKGVGLQLDLQPPEAVVHGDPDSLGMALGNLLDNALKYSPSGTAVILGLRTVREAFHLTVADRGPGIPPDKLPHIFDRFYRADPSRSRETGGFGLGLAMAREAARAHGGELTAASSPGQGTVFTLALPVDNRHL